MEFFKQLSVDHIHNHTIILDIDGTLVADGEHSLDQETINKVELLKKHNNVFLSSNKRDDKRNNHFAELLGILFISKHHRKPSKKVIEEIPEEFRKDYVVIGDKYLTDGLFAHNIKGEFIKVKRVMTGKEDWKTKLVYRLDDAAHHVRSDAGFLKYFKNTGWMFSARVVSLGISFIANIFVIRHLGPLNNGELSYAVSFATLCSFIAGLGIDQILFRELIERPEDKNKILGTALTLKFIAGFLTSAILIVVARALHGDSLSFLLIAIASLSYLFNQWNIIAYEFQSHVKSKYPAVISIFVIAILSAIKIYTVYANKGVIYLAAIFVIEPILYMIMYIIIRYKHYGSIFQWSFDKETAKLMLRHALPLMISSGFAVIYSRIDQVLLKSMVSTTAVGVYDAAVRLAEGWYFLPGIIISSLYPAIVNSKKTSEALYFSRIKRLSLFLVILAVGVSLPVSLLAKPIMRILYGEAFLPGAIVLQIYIWAGIGTSLTYLVNQIFISERNQFAVLMSSLFAMVLNVVLNLLLIPHYGIAGSAFATLISYFGNSVAIFLFPKTRPIAKKIFLID